MNKILIIHNPKSGSAFNQNWYKKYFLNHFKKYLPNTEHDLIITTPELENQLKAIKFTDYPKVIVIGGDGTVKEVADYLLKNNLNIPLAIIPAGSANVLASSLSISLKPKQAIKTACLGTPKKIDVCILNNTHYFLICLSIGFWSDIINETSRGLKINLGFMAYLMTFIKQRQVKKTNFNFMLDKVNHNIEGNTLIIANALSLFNLTPKTPIDLFDSELEVLISHNKSIIGFLNVAFSFSFGKNKFPYLTKLKGKKITLSTESFKDKAVQIDGEEIKVNEINIELIPKKLLIITK